MKSRRHKTGNVRHVDHQDSTDLVAYFPESLKVNCSGICACACYNHLRLTFQRQFAHPVIIEETVVVNTIWYYIKIFTGHIDRRTMRKVSAMVKIHAHDGVTRLQNGKLHCHVCLRA